MSRLSNQPKSVLYPAIVWFGVVASALLLGTITGTYQDLLSNPFGTFERALMSTFFLLFLQLLTLYAYVLYLGMESKHGRDHYEPDRDSTRIDCPVESCPVDRHSRSVLTEHIKIKHGCKPTVANAMALRAEWYAEQGAEYSISQEELNSNEYVVANLEHND